MIMPLLPSALRPRLARQAVPADHEAVLDDEEVDRFFRARCTKVAIRLSDYPNGSGWLW